jgi:hypothetical protein
MSHPRSPAPRIAAPRLCGALLVIALGLVARGAPAEIPMSQEGQRKLREHRDFVRTTKRYPSDVFENINFGDQRARSITFIEGPLVVDGELLIDIPRDIARHWGRGRELRVVGEGAKTILVFLRHPDGSRSKFKNWWYDAKAPARFWNMRSARPQPGTEEGYQLVLTGKGRIDRIQAHSVHGISLTFDPLPYSRLGVGLPTINTTLTVDLTSWRTIEGIGEFDHTKYYRLYAAPTASTKGEAAMAQAYIMGKNFYPGRQQMKLDSLGRWRKPVIREDTKRPGWHDRTWVQQYIQANADPAYRQRFLSLFPPDFQYAMCFDNWPRFMHVRNPPAGIFNSRGTPDVTLFAAAAQLASDMITIDKALQGRTATWWEVKNETDVSSEWMYHSYPDKDGWKLLADFHNTVADTIHRDHPKVQVGGPTACNINLSWRDYGTARNFTRFFDLTRDHLDFYALHYYGGFDVLRPGPSDFLRGGMQANTDVLRNHLAATGNLKPFLVSEGGGTGGKDAFSHYKQLHGNAGVMSFFINNPQIFNLTTLFTLPVTWWNKNNKASLFVYTDDGRFEMSPQCLFLEMWKDHLGRRVPVASPHRDLALHALLNGAVLSVAITNKLPNRCSIDLNTVLPAGIAIASAQRTRLYLDIGELIFTREPIKDGKVALAGGETTMLAIRLSEPPQPTKTLDERTFYGDKILQRTGQDLAIKLEAKTAGLHAASLRIAYQPDKARTPLTLALNGRELPFPDLASYATGSLSSLVIPVPTALVKAQNAVQFNGPPSGGMLGAVLLHASYLTTE